MKKTKNIICYNCGVEFSGYICLPSLNSSCPECKEKGFKRNFSKEKQDAINLKTHNSRKTKEVKCYNCEKNFIGSFNTPNKISPCPECREKGLKINRKKFTKEKQNEINLKIRNSRKTKEVKCYNCGKIFIGSFNTPNKISPCPECKEKGIKRNYPKGKIQEIILKRNNSTNKFKEVKCYNCRKIFIGSFILSNNISPCPECKEKGFKRNYSKEKQDAINLKIKNTKNNFSKEKQDGINKKHQKTMLKNHNVDHPSKMENYNDKVKTTNQRRRGVDHISQTEEWKIKYKETSLKNWNVDHPNKSNEVQKKRRVKSFKNLGSSHWKKSKKFKLEFFNIIKSQLKNFELIDNYYQSSYFKHNWKCLKCNNIIKAHWNDIQQGYKCPTCYPRIGNTSFAELEILEFIKSLNISNNISHGTRKVINPLELDIYIKDKNIAIEFNGLRWHSEEWQEKGTNDNHPYTPETYHLYKTQKCEDIGIQLIHIFEDEWYFKKEIVKVRLKQILGANSNQKRIHARECIIKEISPQIKNEFLEKFHIQGKDSSSIKLGAFFEDNLISVMTFSKGNISKGSKSIEGVWELNRFCSDSNLHIPGIAGKLLSYFKKNYNWIEIFSYADRRWSQGNLYHKLGFELLSRTGPNYWYLKDFKRIHRFSLRKRPNEPKDIPESILRFNEGYGKIWDCGSLKFKLLKS